MQKQKFTMESVTAADSNQSNKFSLTTTLTTTTTSFYC